MEQPAGSRIDRHVHDNHQLLYMSSGASQLWTDAGSWIAPPDRAIWIPAGCQHEHRFHGPTSFHSIGFASALIPGRTTPLVLAVTPLARELIIACSTADLPGPKAAAERHHAGPAAGLHRHSRPRQARSVSACARSCSMSCAAAPNSRCGCPPPSIRGFVTHAPSSRRT